MKCSNCHAEIPNGSKTCPKCDTILADFFQDVVLTKKQKVILFLHRMMFILIFIFAFLFFDGFLLFKYIEKNNIVSEPNFIESDELYVSTNKYYKYILNSDEKKIYDIIFNAISNYEDSVVIDLNEYNLNQSDFVQDTIRNVKHVLSMDHPELINFGSINISEKNDNIIKLIINYSISFENLEDSNSKVIESLDYFKTSTDGMSDYDKVNFVYDYFDSNVNIIDVKDTKYFTAYSCFIYKECTMNGVTSAVQLIFSKIGVESSKVVGAKMNKYYEWNIVKIDDKYYNYDQTAKRKFFKDSNYILYHKNVLPNIDGKKYLIK